jgi:RNA polymerase sigma factor (sigma-70 family)
MYTDTQILQGIKNNDSKVVSYVYGNYYPVVCCVVRSMCKDFESIDDLFQDVMLILCEQANELQLKCKLKTYICGIAKKLVFNENRRKRKQNTVNTNDCHCFQREISVEEEYETEVEREAVLKHYLRLLPASDIEKYKAFIDRKPGRIAKVKYKLQRRINKDACCKKLIYQ